MMTHQNQQNHKKLRPLIWWRADSTFVAFFTWPLTIVVQETRGVDWMGKNKGHSCAKRWNKRARNEHEGTHPKNLFMGTKNIGLA